MRISLLNLLLIVAVAAMATALYSLKRTADANLEAITKKADAERQSFKEWKAGELQRSRDENLFLRNLSGLPSFTDYGRIQCRVDPREVAGFERHGVLAVLDPRKNYAIYWLRRWGSDEAQGETKREEHELVIEAAPAELFVNRMLELSILAAPHQHDDAMSWAFSGHVTPVLRMHESRAQLGSSGGASGEYLWCKMLRQLKVSKTSLVRSLKDCFNLESTIQQRPTQMCWITGFSDESKDIQSIYVTIEELTPERLTELSAAPRFHEYKHPQFDP